MKRGALRVPGARAKQLINSGEVGVSQNRVTPKLSAFLLDSAASRGGSATRGRLAEPPNPTISLIRTPLVGVWLWGQQERT